MLLYSFMNFAVARSFGSRLKTKTYIRTYIKDKSHLKAFHLYLPNVLSGIYFPSILQQFNIISPAISPIFVWIHGSESIASKMYFSSFVHQIKVCLQIQGSQQSRLMLILLVLKAAYTHNYYNNMYSLITESFCKWFGQTII